MSTSWFRVLACRFCRQLINVGMTDLNPNDLGHSAVVFSPHFDDETLGCGGTIIKKKRAGAEVKIVFMTDGSKSHRHLIPENDLRRIRAREGLAASRSLGLSGSDVVFLDFEETHLSRQHDCAIDKVVKILTEQRPEEVFIPYSKEPSLWSDDHLATTSIVRAALLRCARAVVVFEYPVWFWNQWPWVSVPMKCSLGISKVLKNGLLGSWRLMRDFRCRIYVGDVLGDKRTALDQHQSQMTRLIPHLPWPTLADVSDEEFLECFFHEHEIFRRCSTLITLEATELLNAN